MKKNLTLLLLAILVFPSVAFASWWNPLSWFDNWSFPKKVDTKTELLEKRIQELESKLGSSDTTGATITPTTTPTVIREVVEKRIPSIDNTAVLQAQARAKAEAEALILKQKADEQVRLETLRVELERQVKERALEDAREARERVDRENQKIQDKFDKKQAKLDAINLEIANLNAKYAEDTAERKLNNNGGSQGFMERDLNSLYSKYTDDYNAFMAEFQQIKYSN